MVDTQFNNDGIIIVEQGLKTLDPNYPSVNVQIMLLQISPSVPNAHAMSQLTPMPSSY